MKKMILPAVCFMIIAETTAAQTRNSRHRASTANSAVITSASTDQKETAATTAQTDNSREGRSTLITVIPDNRKEYMQDGQLATYTGHQATAINAGEFQSLRKTDNEIRRKDEDQKE